MKKLGSFSLVAGTRRALPRVLVSLLGLALVGADTDGSLLFFVGIAVFVFSALEKPAAWWHYVRTGAYPEGSAAQEFTEVGHCSVELQSADGRSVEVWKALREVTGAGLADVKRMVEVAPITISEGLSLESAARVRDRLARSGATATIDTR